MNTERKGLIGQQGINNRLVYRLQIIASLIVIAIIMALMDVIQADT